MSWMDDDHIAAALSQMCVTCGVGPGDECVHVTKGTPLIDEPGGYPVHLKRLEP